MAVNLLTKYGNKLDQAFRNGLYTSKAVNQDYNFTGAKTIEVMTVDTQELVDYNRASTGDRYGGNNELQDTKTSYTLSNDKSFKIAIDKGNYLDQGELKKAGEVLKLQMNERVYPLIDKNRFGKVAATVKTNTGKFILAAGKEYDAVLDMNAFLDESETPIEGRYLFVTPDFYKGIKKQVVESAQAPNTNDTMIKKGFVGEIDGVPVVKVPASYMPTDFKALMWHKQAVLAPQKIADSRIITDSELVDGSILVGRFYFDAFVLKAKEKAVTGVATK